MSDGGPFATANSDMYYSVSPKSEATRKVFFNEKGSFADRFVLQLPHGSRAMLGKQSLRPTIDYELLGAMHTVCMMTFLEPSNLRWVKEAMVHVVVFLVQSSFYELDNTVQLADKGTRALPLHSGGDVVLKTRRCGKRRLFSKRPRPMRVVQRCVQFCKDCSGVHT